MVVYLKRLVASLGAYQLANVLAKLIAVVMLPFYTRYLSTSDYGTIELLANGVILSSILVRLGMIEAFLRFYFTDSDQPRRAALARRATAWLLLTTTIASALLLVFAAPLSGVVLSHRSPGVFRVAVLGLWSFTNLELAYQLLRVDERLRLFAAASVANVLLTVAATVTLVIVLNHGPEGYLLGNYGASTVILASLWWIQRDRLRPAQAQAQRMVELMRFGLPTVPAEASVYLLSIVDRYYLYHSRSAALAGIYSIAVKLAGAVAFIVNAFQYAWPPLAYSVTDDAEAGRLYGLVATYYLLVCGYVVAALALLGRWVLRLLAAPAFFDAYKALPWLALGWALYGLWVIFLTIAGRAKVTSRNFAAALVGLVANVVLLLVLVGPAGLGLAGAGIALCGAYVFMLGFMHLLTRRSFAVAFEWARLARLAVVFGGIAAAGDALLPTSGLVGLALRVLVCAAIAPVLWATGFVHPAEVQRARSLVARVVAARRAASA